VEATPEQTNSGCRRAGEGMTERERARGSARSWWGTAPTAYGAFILWKSAILVRMTNGGIEG
jgi:hypothetical protein